MRRFVNLVFVWALLITLIPEIPALGIDISRTRELFSVYLLSAVVLLGRPWRHLAPRTLVPVVTLWVLAVIALISWTSELGWAIGLNFIAAQLLFATCLLFGATFASKNWDDWRGILIGLGLAGALLQAIMLLRELSKGTQDVDHPLFYEYRPVLAPLALLMVVAFALLVDDQSKSARIRVAGASFLGVSAIISQHRSVWVALLAVLALLGWHGWRRADRVVRDAVSIVVGFLAVAVLLPAVSRFSVLPGAGTPEGGIALPEAASSTSTLGWRYDLWVSRLSAPRSPVEWLLGGTFGETPAKGPHSATISPLISAHSLYVELITLSGLIGLLMFTWLLWLAWTKRTHNGVALSSIIVGLLGFGVFYTWPAFGWLLLGAAVAGVGHASREASHSPEIATRV